LDDAPLADVHLLAQIRDGQIGALDELYSRYSRLVYSIALSIVAEQMTAEEITLDVFIKVWEKADTYRADRGSVPVWLSSMARNRAIDVLRRDRARFNAQHKFWAENVSPPNANERNPESTAELEISKARLRVAISRLTDEQRDLLALAYFQGYTQSEIAELRDLPLGTVKTRLRMGIQKLRQLLRENRDD
jgi:RNA polymerase sigma-70 factor (ECF subfamily)